MRIKRWLAGEENPWGMSIEEAAKWTKGDMSGADPGSHVYEEAMRVLEWERHRKDLRWVKLAALGALATAVATTVIAIFTL